MMPNRRGRPPKKSEGSGAEASMPKRKAQANIKGKGKTPQKRNNVPDVYREMLAEAIPAQSDSPERPLKKRKTARRDIVTKAPDPAPASDDIEDDEDMEFEDVLSSPPEHPKPQQTIYRDSDESEDEEEEDDYAWENADLDLDIDPGKDEPSGDLELTLTKRPEPKPITTRRKVVSKDGKIVRLMVHKIHVLCLLSFIEKRNRWINDVTTQKALIKLMSAKTQSFLRPKDGLTQFAHKEVLMRGLGEIIVRWKTKFQITQRGMRRALWAEDEKDIEDYQLPDDSDTTFDKSEFQKAATALQGSRDLGAQLFCSLLRGAGVETRLVCSLQPLSFHAGGPSMPRPSPKKRARPVTPKQERPNINHSNYQFGGSPSTRPALPLNPRHRLGHPNAAAYSIPDMSSPAAPRSKPTKPIRESPCPVFWVEVFNESRQNWVAVDPFNNSILDKPRVFEPPASDKENAMSYVIAIEEDGTMRDVTLRYARAYNAKTRKHRVESTPKGDRWWRKVLRYYGRGYPCNADQIEDGELAEKAEQEKMPTSIADFKDHPYYALERHLRRNEVLVNRESKTKVAAGRDPDSLGGKKYEFVYKRKDVKIARSANNWYRLGRDIKNGEQPVKVLEPKRRLERDDMDDEDERAGTNLYTEAQTELCDVPPVVNGKVPKNRYGNLDVYVPTMVPRGGVHLAYPEAKDAARLLNIDYADAVTGFEFRGRHGTAVIKGIIVATEYKEAIEAVIAGLRDEAARAVEDAKAEKAVRMWKRLLVALRIRERVNVYYAGDDEVDGAGGVEEGEREKAQEDMDMDMEDDSDVSEYNDDEGGGFIPE